MTSHTLSIVGKVGVLPNSTCRAAGAQSLENQLPIPVPLFSPEFTWVYGEVWTCLCGASKQRAVGQVGVPGHPPAVGGAPEHIARLRSHTMESVL